MWYCVDILLCVGVLLFVVLYILCLRVFCKLIFLYLKDIILNIV